VSFVATRTPVRGVRVPTNLLQRPCFEALEPAGGSRRQRVVATKYFLVVVSVVLAACGASSGGRSEPETSRGLYATTATVLSSSRQSPMLCLGTIAESLPPQCGDVPITNWDWQRVEDEERAAGRTWGRYQMIGTYDGEAFTVTDVKPAAAGDPPNDDDPTTTPCDTPEGGWPVPDPSRDDDDDVIAANAAVGKDPEFAGLWVQHGLPATASKTRSLTLLNVAFTGNLARHEAVIREHWGGPLCLVEFERSLRELKRIQRKLSDKEFNIKSLWSDIDVRKNQVNLGVVAIDDSARKALDDRYGPGTVQTHPALRPVR
jgi:hypothetical protein